MSLNAARFPACSTVRRYPESSEQPGPSGVVNRFEPTPTAYLNSVIRSDHAAIAAHAITGRNVAKIALCALAVAAVFAGTVDAPAGPPEGIDLSRSPKCYPSDLPPEIWEQIIEENGALPPTWGPVGTDYVTDTTVWVGDIAQGPSGRAQPAHFTYSFAPDGTTWGLPSISSTGPSDLSANLITLFGTGNLDRGREYLRQAIAGWRRTAGTTYDEVADDGAPMDQLITRMPTRGDIRIGGRGFGTGSFLAYNAFPSPGFAGVGGGDMCFNTSYFLPGNFSDPSSNYRYLRNTTGHEHGHGLGYIHVIPCNNQFLMEPVIALGFDMQTIDEIRGVQRNYGDRFAGNHDAASAHDLGNLTTPTVRSVIERQLSTNGVSGFGNTHQDWFRFTIDTDEDVVITVAPTGGSYTNGQQAGGCSGSSGLINAQQAGNLNIELRDETGTTVLMSAASAGPGANETINAPGLAAGTYTVRIFDVGPNPPANQILQLYDLTVRVANANAPPAPCAGLNKRVAANTNCYFMGNILSRPNETNATLSNASYDWDLEGDGVFETLDNPAPSRQYISNGVYPATLRLTDSLGGVAYDTINVVVHGGVTTLSSVVPSLGRQGETVPIAINGTNLKNVTSLSHLTLSGPGVTLIGTPTPNVLGTQVTGVSVEVACDAPPTIRALTVSNQDGTATLYFAFSVRPSLVTPGDLNCDCTVDENDVGAFVLALIDPAAYQVAYPWCNRIRGDINGDAIVDGDDVQDFLELLP